MDNCIFCKIVNGKIGAHKVYENDLVLGFMDIHPVNPGHVLVIPKKHEPHIWDLDVESYSRSMEAVKKIGQKIHNKLGYERTGIVVAGYDIPHTHIHIVPMKDYNDITTKDLLEGKVNNPSSEELEEMAQKLR